MHGFELQSSNSDRWLRVSRLAGTRLSTPKCRDLLGADGRAVDGPGCAHFPSIVAGHDLFMRWGPHAQLLADGQGEAYQQVRRVDCELGSIARHQRRSLSREAAGDDELGCPPTDVGPTGRLCVDHGARGPPSELHATSPHLARPDGHPGAHGRCGGNPDVVVVAVCLLSLPLQPRRSSLSR